MPALPIVNGATLPDPGNPGTPVWSTIGNEVMVWDGTQWLAQSTAPDAHHVHTQGVPASTWVIEHNLGKVPAITVIDSAGDEVRGSIRHDSANQATLTFAVPFSGVAYCN